jgi:hypothetical protein
MMIMMIESLLHVALVAVTLPIAKRYQLPEMSRSLLLLSAVHSHVTLFWLLLACGCYVITSVNSDQACNYTG